MLDKNPIYQIYKNGKVPVIRFKNDGFTNFIQDEYFKDSLDKNKNINGCFCIIGGMQDSFILSGVDNKEILHIGYVEPDTKVYLPFKHKYTKAKNVLNKGLEQYERILKEETKSDEKYMKYEFSDYFDDFDLIYTQAIVNADEVTEIALYDVADRIDLLHTVNDGFFQLGTYFDFFEPAVKSNKCDEYLKYAEEKDVLNKLINCYIMDMPEELLGKYKVIDRFYELYKKYYDKKVSLDEFHEKQEKMQLLKKLAPKKLDESIEKYDFIEQILDDAGRFGWVNSNYEISVFVDVDGKQVPAKMSVENSKFNFVLNNEKVENLLDKEIIINKSIVNAISNELKNLELISKIDKDATVGDKQLIETFNSLNDFYQTHKDIEFYEDGFKYSIDNFKVEYNLKLDDCVIECDLPEYKDKLYHEEDLIFTFENNQILNIVNEFRKCINNDLEKVNNLQYNIKDR